MPSLKIQVLSAELCHLLGVDPSHENAGKVSTVIAELVAEVSLENTNNYKNIIQTMASNDPHLVERINEGIDAERNILISNLSALR